MAAFVSEISTAQRSAWTLPVLAYAGFAAACGVLLHPTALAMGQTWLASSSYHHGVAVAPLALWMILERPRITPGTDPASLIGVLLAALLWLAGNAAGVALVEQIAFVSLLIAGAGAIFGACALRQWTAPLAFLYFMVPFGGMLIPVLQQATAGAAVAMLGFAGVPVSVDGLLIRTPTGLFEIAEACAGLNFLLAALMIAGLYACQFLKTNKTRLAFMLIAVAVALVANFIRAFALILIATLTDMRIAVGPDHLLIGLVFYGLVLAALLWIGARLARREAPSPERTPSMMFKPWRGAFAAAALAPVILASAYAHFVVNAPLDRTAPTALSPFSAPGWRILPAPQNWRPPMTADRIAGATYENRDIRVYMASGYFTHDRPGAEIVNYHNRAWDNAEWRRIGAVERMIYLFGDAQMTRMDLLAGARGRRLAAITLYWRDGKVYKDPHAFKHAQMAGKLMGRNPEGGIIIIAASYRQSPDEALSAIRPFTHNIEEFASWRARNKASS